jgi:hypothetical protein
VGSIIPEAKAETSPPGVIFLTMLVPSSTS